MCLRVLGIAQRRKADVSERHCAPLLDAQRCPAGTECPWGLSCSALLFLAPGEPSFLSFIFSLALGRVHLAGSFAHHALHSTSLPIMASLHLSPSSPISLSDYPLSYQFPFLPPPPALTPTPRLGASIMRE